MINVDSDPRWLSAVEACALLGIKRATLYAYVSRGKIRAEATGVGRKRAYLREDLELLRASQAPGPGGARSSPPRSRPPVVETRLTAELEGVPHYRGLSALKLAADPGWTFEATAERLWRHQTDGPSVPLTQTWQPLTDPRSFGRRHALASPRPADAVALALLSLGSEDPRHLHLDDAATLALARELCWLAVGSVNLARDPASADWAFAQRSIAAGFLAAWGKKPQRRSVRLVDAALTVVTDGVFDGATLATRAAIADGAELYRACAAGVSALSLNGLPPHRAIAAVDALVGEVAGPDHASRVVRQRQGTNTALPGFATAPDRRVAFLVEHCARSTTRRFRILRALLDAVERMGGPHPQLGLGLLGVAAALNLPAEAAAALYVVGRLAGLVAHAREEATTTVPLAARARYVGAALEG